MNMFASQSMHQGQHENLTYHTKFPKCVTAHPLPFPGNFLIRMFPRSGRPTGRPIGQEHTRNFNPSGRNTVVFVILVIMGLSNVYLYLGPTIPVGEYLPLIHRSTTASRRRTNTSYRPDIHDHVRSLWMIQSSRRIHLLWHIRTLGVEILSLFIKLGIMLNGRTSSSS